MSVEWADWPTLDELKQVLDVTSDDWDGAEDGTRLTAVLDAAISYVKQEIGNWTEYEDIPTVRQSRAALRMAELLALRPEGARLGAATTTVAEMAMDPTFMWYMRGSRRRFSVG